MSLFTGKGDNGTTKVFGCNQRMTKSSILAEALGSLDELNSFLGYCKTKLIDPKLVFKRKKLSEVIHKVQENLFIIQAEVAGAPKKILGSKVKKMEVLINNIEKEIPPITSFIIPGEDEMSALFDVSRTLARKTERRVVAVSEDVRKINHNSLAYLNRLSSLLYALARLSSHLSGIKERSPSYK